MPSRTDRHAAVAAMALLAAALGSQAHACIGAGVVTRIDGRPQDVVITRVENGQPAVVNRPRVLEVICQGDAIKVASPSSATLSVDGHGVVKVGPAGYLVPARSGAPTGAGNAYRALADTVAPDMKRVAWNVRLKGEGDDFGFRLPTLVGGQQSLTAGKRPLLVRLTGGDPPYKVVLKDAGGGVIASASSSESEILLPPVNLAVGKYSLSASDASPRAVDAVFQVVASAPQPDGAFADMPDPEVRAASAAAALAQSKPGEWGFEAEQMLNTAPANGLDRDRVYELVESYGDQ